MSKLKNSLIGLGKLFIPFILGLGVFVVLGLLLDESTRLTYWGLIAAYFFPPLGKESIIPTAILVFHFHPVFIALSIAFIDVVVALFLLWNYDLAKKIPFIGKFMVKVENTGRGFEKKYRWVKPLRFVGIVLFVIVPFQGSGGLVGSIVGRLIGMKPINTFYAIILGAVIGTLLIGFFAKTFEFFAEINTMLTVLLVVVILFTVVGYFIFKKRKQSKKIV